MKQLSEHYVTGKVETLTIQVESLEMLANIERRFVCAAIDTDNELILDCIRIESKEEQAALRELLKVPADMLLPEEGYIVFWR